MSRPQRAPRLTAAVLLTALITALAAGCAASATGDYSGASTAHAVPAADEPFVHAIPTDVNSLDPANTQGNSDQEINHNIYERLLTFRYADEDDGSMVWEGLEVEPQLAESWEVDGPVITFHLRDDVTFYPTGNPLTSEDVRYSFERLTQIVGNGQFQAGVAGIYTPDQIEAVDERTVRITFTNPDGVPTAVPVALASMRFQQFGIVDSVEVKKHATSDDPWATEWLQENVASTGPYYVEKRVPNESITLRAVPDHWSGKQPYYDQVVLRITGGADVVSLLKSGEVDYAAEGLTGRQYDELASSGFDVRHHPMPKIMRLSMAVDSGPTADRAVRQALMHAVPYDQIISTALAGRGERATKFTNPADQLGTENWEAYDHDPAKAKSLLEKAGKSDLTIDLWYSADISYNEDIALLMVDSMAAAGVTVVPQPRPGLQLSDMMRARAAGESDEMDGMYLSEAVIWLDDPETHVDIWGKSDSPSNWPRVDVPDVDRLHREFRKSDDADARAEAYETIQELLFEEAAVNPLVVVGRTVVTVPGLQGITFTPGPYAQYRYIEPAE